MEANPARFVLVPLLALLLGACEFFGDEGNRPPRIAWGELFVADIAETFEVRMRAGGADPDGNLDRIDCTGDIAYSGPSPADTTVSFPLAETGEDVVTQCTATDTEGLVSSAVPMFLTLPDSTAPEEATL